MATARMARRVSELRQIQLAEFEAKNAAAIKLQCFFRFKSLGNVGLMAILASRRLNKKSKAALIIQRVVRGHFDRCSEYLSEMQYLRTTKHKSASTIQCAYKAHLCRRDYSAAQKAAAEHRFNEAARTIQTNIRIFIARRAFSSTTKRMLHATRVIQRFCACWFQPRHAQQVFIMHRTLEQVVAAQAWARRYLARKKAREMRAAARHHLISAIWLLFHLVALILFIVATVSERGNGDFYRAGRALAANLFPPASACLGCPRRPVPQQVAHPDQFWSWLAGPLVSSYQATGAAPLCSAAAANARNCSWGAARPGMLAVGDMEVLQKRTLRTAFPLPNAGARPPCPPAPGGEIRCTA